MPTHLSMTAFIDACKRPLRPSIRVNTLKISVAAFLERAEEKGWELEPVPWCSTGFWFKNSGEDDVRLGNTAEHLAGLFYIQEASSMMPVTALLHDQPELGHVLDMAAAPGSKTTQLAAAMENNGVLVANEFSSSRIKMLHANIRRCGVSNVAMTHFDARVFGGWLPESFDAILLDAPCSGEGTIRKDPAAMDNWSVGSTEEIAETQKDLIVSAFHALKPGGSMVYSTCTLNMTENQQVCHFLKETFGDAIEFEPLNNLFENASASATDDGFLHIFPQTYDCEGFFVARLKKNRSVGSKMVKKRMGKFPFTKAEKKDCQVISETLENNLGLSLPENTSIWLRDKEVWVFPKNIETMLSELKFDRIGFKLADTHKKGYRWQHEAIIALAKGIESSALEISALDAIEWYKGRDIRPSELVGKGEVIVCYRGQPIGMGKWVGSRVKNNLPRELVRDSNLFSQ